MSEDVSGMQKRRLGRTNLKVSTIGFGGMHIYPSQYLSEINYEEATKVVRRSFDVGMNYFDTASAYGAGLSEERIGAALEDVRDQCILATKTRLRTKKESLSEIEGSLRRLKTDRVDIIQLHGIDDTKTLEKAMGPDGSYETCKEARSKGLADYIGITGHKPAVLVEAIKTNKFDTVLVPLSVTTRHALEDLVPLAKEMDIGVIAMKSLACKIASITMTWTYEEPLGLFTDEPGLRTFLGENENDRVRSALRWVLAQEVDTIVLGLKSVEEVNVAAKVGEEFDGLTNEEKKRLGGLREENYCRDCGLCLPCPQGVNISAMLRFHDLFFKYDLKKWARRLYKPLSVKAEACNECGECEEKCPYDLQIIDMLQDVKRYF